MFFLINKIKNSSNRYKKNILIVVMFFLMAGVFLLWVQQLQGSLMTEDNNLKKDENLSQWSEIGEAINIFFEVFLKTRDEVLDIKNSLNLN